MRQRAVLFSALLLLFAAVSRADVPPAGGAHVLVVDAAGQPIAGATVIVSAGAALMLAGQTDVDGIVLFIHIPASAYSMAAVIGDHRTPATEVVIGEQTVERRLMLPVDSETITIGEHAPPATPPRAILSSVARVLPRSAIDGNRWAIGWLLLDVDARGQVGSFRFLHSPGRGLERIAAQEVWKLRFEPASDAAGRPVPSQLVWRMEWPAIWRYQGRATRSTPDGWPFRPSLGLPDPNARARSWGSLGEQVGPPGNPEAYVPVGAPPGPFVLPPKATPGSSPCGDCALDLDRALAAPPIVRAAST